MKTNLKANLKAARHMLESVGFSEVAKVINKGGVLLVDVKAVPVMKMERQAEELARQLGFSAGKVTPTYGGKLIRIADYAHQREITFTRYNGCKEMHVEFVDTTH